MIALASLQRTAEELMAKAAIEIPDDYLDGMLRCADTEKGDLSAFVIKAMLENYEAAKEDRRAMCGDTGLPRWYVKIGNEARVEGGPVALEAALRRATARATTRVPLRPNRVHPLWRTDHNNNVGINAPEIEYAFHPDADWIELTTVHKGGLFGTDYRMLFPGDGIEGIKRFYLDTLVGFGKRGLACQPAIVGIGLGGSKDISMVLGKQASCLRIVGSRNPDPRIAALAEEFKELGNSIGMGAMGFVGGRGATAREGGYKGGSAAGAGRPAGKDRVGTTTCRCSPAARINPEGSYPGGAVTAAASFRFAQWLDGWFRLSGCNII